ncbi:nickel-dependent hydrogenase large subunit [Candidatus Thioglobus sp.]|uniref:nickel-dependent hydrogenase large subunit n=1 Tax=Candidatus Thioglobus sp. TaxID=2026721 RepID=UPI00177A487B|nr:hypothetical protein [Candidatus Thioglobus sp.]
MSIEGEIKIEVEGRHGQVKSVSITSSRPLHITQLFKSKSIFSVSDLLNTLYQLCNTAHQFSFLRLLDDSGIVKLSQNEKLAYQLLLDIETIREHCFSIASKWNPESDKSVDTNIINLLTTLKEIGTFLFPDSDPLSLRDKNLQDYKSIDKLITKLESQLGLFLIGNNSNVFDQFSDLDHFNRWLKNSDSRSTTFLNFLKDHKFDQLGNIEALHMPKVDLQDFSTLMQDSNFIKQPMYQGQVFETTPLSRQSKSPLIKQLSEIYGNGLFVRSVAQLVEVFELLKGIKCNYIKLKAEEISYHFQYSEGESNAIVQLDAARGNLVHQMCVDKDKIDSYQILAPTEWNFHPRGVLYKMIKTLTYQDNGDLFNQIKLLVNAVDPCVGYSIKIKNA